MSGARPAGREDGVVLLLVLVIIVLTISAAYALARHSLLEVASMRQRAQRVRAEILARSGYAIALRAIVDDVMLERQTLDVAFETAQDPWALLAQQAIVPSDDGPGEIQLRIEDAGARINLNGLVTPEGKPHGESLAFLTSLLERIIDDMPGRTEDKLYDPPEDLAKGILDWIDADDITPLGEDELRHYGLAPPSRPLVTLDELSEIPTMDGELIESLEYYFTTYPLFPPLDEVGVNPNTAPPHVLAAVYYGSEDERRMLRDADVDLFRALKWRSEGRIFCPQTEECEDFQGEIVGSGETVFPPVTYASSLFWIRSEGRYETARVAIEAIVDRTDPEALETLYYRLD